jgi:Ca-activated chloride channel family protein
MNRTPLAIALAALALVACPTPEGPDAPDVPTEAAAEPLPDGARPMATAVPNAPVQRARRIAPADDALAALPALQTQDCSARPERKRRPTGLNYGRGSGPSKPKAKPAFRPAPNSGPLGGIGGLTGGDASGIGGLGTRGLGSSGSGAGGGGKGGEGAAPAATPAAPPPVAASAPEAEAEPAEARTSADPAPLADAPADAGDWGAEADDMLREEEAKTEKRGVLERQEPVMDWGATVHLSNDDSMSLASAQRLLWAVANQRTFTASEVRPHELLNYFSFDTVPVAAGAQHDDTRFSVLGTARTLDLLGGEPDTLGVAFAVQGAIPARQPLDLSLVVDRSGSMWAEGRMAYVKRGLNTMVEQLEPGDRVDLTLFDNKVCTPVKNFVVGRDDASVLTNAINAMTPRGSTNLDAGLREAYGIQTARAEADPVSVQGRNRRVMVLTDALLNSGNVNKDLVSEVGKQFEENGIRITGVGVGREFDDTMLDRLTEKGKGAYVYLGSEAVVDRVFGPGYGGFDSLVQTLAHDVRFSIELPDSLAMERFYGEEASTNEADIQPIHYYAGTSQVFLQDLKVKAGEMDGNDRVLFRIRYRAADTGEPQEEVFHTTVGALMEADARNLHKAKALMAWSDLLTERALGDRSCASLPAYRQAVAKVQDDAEIAYVNGLTETLCRLPAGSIGAQTIARANGVELKVRVDADIAIPEVALECSGQRIGTESLSGSDTIARFDDALPGTCELTLQGTVPMHAKIEVPATGGDVRCLVRGGRLGCS